MNFNPVDIISIVLMANEIFFATAFVERFTNVLSTSGPINCNLLRPLDRTLPCASACATFFADRPDATNR